MLSVFECCFSSSRSTDTQSVDTRTNSEPSLCTRFYNMVTELITNVLYYLFCCCFCRESERETSPNRYNVRAVGGPALLPPSQRVLPLASSPISTQPAAGPTPVALPHFDHLLNHLAELRVVFNGTNALTALKVGNQNLLGSEQAKETFIEQVNQNIEAVERGRLSELTIQLGNSEQNIHASWETLRLSGYNRPANCLPLGAFLGPNADMAMNLQYCVETDKGEPVKAQTQVNAVRELRAFYNQMLETPSLQEFGANCPRSLRVTLKISAADNSVYYYRWVLPRTPISSTLRQS